MVAEKITARFGKRLLVASAITLALAGLLWFANRETPYVVQGRSLKEWVQRANNGDDRARRLLQNLGPETIPHLTKLLADGPSPLSRIYVRFWLKTPPNLREKVPAPEYDIRPDVLPYLGSYGKEASSAVPEILRYLELTEDHTSGRFSCYDALVMIGEGAGEAIPALLARAEKTQEQQEMFLICLTLSRVTPPGTAEVVSRLEALARGTNAPLLRISCALASQSIRPDPGLIEEVVAPLFGQWKRALQADETRSHTSRMNLITAADIIGAFETNGGPARDLARQTVSELEDRQLQRRVASALELKHSEHSL